MQLNIIVSLIGTRIGNFKVWTLEFSDFKECTELAMTSFVAHYYIMLLCDEFYLRLFT